MKTELAAILDSYLSDNYDSSLEESAVKISPPKHKKFGDIATNFAMVYAPRLSKKPRDIAEEAKDYLLNHSDCFAKVEVAGPGFINCFYNQEYLLNILAKIEREEQEYGKNSRFQGQKALVEFVSANPTGPLHVGHGRGAVVGDVLSRLYEANGYEVTREYYYNDAGVQMRNLGESLRYRYQELFGEPTVPDENLYRGEYIKEIAQKLRREKGDSWLKDVDTSSFTEYASNAIIKMIKEDLASLHIQFDSWFRESSLFEDEKVEKAFHILKEKGYLYKSGGATYVKTSLFGDEKDRVIIKSDATTTYFASDIAYHQDKLERGYHQLINVMGADHHGYIPRLEASIKMLENDDSILHTILVQMVSFVKDGQNMKLSTRKGDFVTLRDMIDELGTGVIRYFFSMRKPDSQMVFDWDIAREESMSNPAYYVQYANARINSVFEKALANKYNPDEIRSYPVKDIPLDSEEKKELILHLSHFPQAVSTACDVQSPHLLCEFATELARRFHVLYNSQRFLVEDASDSYSNLKFISIVQQVLENCAFLLGLPLPKAM